MWRSTACDRVTKRGDVLVFGGDAVYPVASREAYERQLVAPYRTALPSVEPPYPKVFAVAGNHDWYDSLVAFTRIFCTGGKRRFAAWQTHQSRSYFAIKLPHGWWLVGTDVQLESDIDDPQLEYFGEDRRLDGARRSHHPLQRRAGLDLRAALSPV